MKWIPEWLCNLAIIIVERYGKEHEKDWEEERNNRTDEEWNEIFNAGEDDRGNPIH